MTKSLQPRYFVLYSFQLTEKKHGSGPRSKEQDSYLEETLK